MIKENLRPDSIIRFWEKVEMIPFHECWEWTAARNERGYGIFGVGKNTDKAHRISYRLTKGHIPPGMFILHSCDNPGCVNPAHLRTGTPKENSQDAIIRKRASKPPPMGGHNRIEVPTEIISLLGKIPDTELGRRMGCSKAVLRRIRAKLGITALPSQTRFKKGDPHPRWSRKRKEE